ncbi:MAG: hypothetical protein KIT84_38035 [Labilithrix sp.]|nr:hypothetical protein [Labilithrix sp.]MCW5816859.1 hypothetical protein [Labilithrix sp.]
MAEGGDDPLNATAEMPAAELSSSALESDPAPPPSLRVPAPPPPSTRTGASVPPPPPKATRLSAPPASRRPPPLVPGVSRPPPPPLSPRPTSSPPPSRSPRALANDAADHAAPLPSFPSPTSQAGMRAASQGAIRAAKPKSEGAMRAAKPAPTSQRGMRAAKSAVPATPAASFPPKPPPIPSSGSAKPPPIPSSGSNAKPAAPAAPKLAPIKSATAPPSIAPSVTPSQAPGSPWRQVLDRATREVEARAATEPTRAAMLLAAEARIFLDAMDDPLRASELLTRAESLAPDARFVAHTLRWLAEQGADPSVVLQRTAAELAHLEGKERVALLWYRGAIQEHAASDLAGAEATMREVLALEGSDLGAWDTIAALRIKQKDTRDDVVEETKHIWSGVLEALDAMAQTTTDSAMRGALHGAAGALQDRYSGEEEALASLRRALEADPNNIAARAAIQSILLRRRDWDEYVRMLVVEAGAIEDPRASRERWERAGDVYAERIGDHAQAAQCLLRAAGLAEHDPGPVEKLALVLETAGRWEEAAAAYEKLLARLHDPQAKAWALVRLGRLREARLDEHDEALAAYRLAVETAPAFTPAVHALLAMAQARGHAGLVLDLERREAERIADPRARAVRWAALAERLEAANGPRDEIASMHERVLTLEPTNSTSFEALDRMYRASNQWPRVVGLYETAIEATTDARRRRALRLELAEVLHVRTNDAARAADLLGEVLAEEEPAPIARFDKLVAHTRALADAGRWAEHVAALEAQAELLEGDEAIAMRYRVGATIEARIGDPRRALAAYEAVLARDPKHEAAAIATLRIHEREGSWEQVVAARRRLVEIAPRPDDAALGLIDIARVQEERLGKIEDAIATYAEALERTPSSAPVLAALERLLRKTSQYERLAKALQRFAETSTERTAQVRLLLRAAIVLELCVEDRDLAADAYARTLDATLLGGDADRYAALWGALRLHEVRGDWNAVDRILVELLDLSPEPTARLRVLVRLARLAELRLDDPGRAARHWDEALGAGARPVEVAADRVRVARLGNKANDVASTLEQLAQATTDPDLARGVVRRMALAAEQESALGADDATALYEMLLLADAEDPLALDGLVRCAAASSSIDDARLAKALLTRARATADVPIRTLLAFAAGVVDDGSGRTSDAEAGYALALETDAELLPALDAARALRAQAGDWAAVAAFHERAAQASLDPENAARSWLDCAEVHEQRLGSSIRALGAYRALLDREPEHPRAFARALELLEASSDWHGAVKVLQAHAEAAPDPAVKAKCYTQRAGILAARLGATPGAIADLRRALALRPDEDDPATVEVLALLEERVKNWQEALQLHGRVAEATTDAATRRRARLAQARIYEEELDDHAQAETLLRDLADHHPDDREIRHRLANAAARGGHEERALDLYAELGESGSPAERARALVALAGLIRSRPDTWPASQAESALSRAFDLALTEPSAIAALEERFTKDGDFRPFVQQAEAAMTRVPPNTPGVLAMRAALARVHRERLGNPDAADRQLIAAIQSFPDSIPTRLALAANLRGRNDEGALTELRGAVKVDPFAAEPFQALVTLTIATGRPEIGVLVASAAQLLGATGDEIEITLDDATALRPIEGSLLVEEAMNRLVGPSRCWALRSIFAVLDPFLPKLFPGQEALLAQHPPLPDSYTLVSDARGVAAALGAPPPLLCRGTGKDALLLQTEPRALVVGNELVGDAGRPIGLFHVAYACTRIAASGSIYTLPRAQILALLEAVLPSTDETPAVKDLRKRVSSVLPRKTKKDLERVVAQASTDPRQELPHWEAEEARRALYAAILFARDLRAVAHVLAPDVPHNIDAPARRAALAQNPTMREVLEFTISPQCWDTFRRLYGRT